MVTKKNNKPDIPLMLRNMTCPYCKKDLTNAAKILGGYGTDVMKFHLDLHRWDAIRELIYGVKQIDPDQFKTLKKLVDRVEQIEDTIGCLE